MRRAPSRLARGALVASCLALSACCAGADLAVGAYDPRIALEARATYALLAPVLDEPSVWAYASSAAVASDLSAHYRPLPASPTAVDDMERAPAELRAVLFAVDDRLRELGYRPRQTQPVDFVVVVGLTTDASGALTRVSLDVGGELDGRFRPDLISLMALVPSEDACPVTAVELATELAEALPPHEDAPE